MAQPFKQSNAVMQLLAGRAAIIGGRLIFPRLFVAEFGEDRRRPLAGVSDRREPFGAGRRCCRGNGECIAGECAGGERGGKRQNLKSHLEDHFACSKVPLPAPTRPARGLSTR